MSEPANDQETAVSQAAALPSTCAVLVAAPSPDPDEATFALARYSVALRDLAAASEAERPVALARTQAAWCRLAAFRNVRLGAI